MWSLWFVRITVCICMTRFRPDHAGEEADDAICTDDIIVQAKASITPLAICRDESWSWKQTRGSGPLPFRMVMAVVACASIDKDCHG